MTLKKSMFSIAAAGAIAAVLTGCGSSGSSSSSSSSSSTTGITSSVKAVDGYLYNSVVKAYYLEDDNVTMSNVTLDSTTTTKDTAAGVWTSGSSTYTLADTNTSIVDQIKFFTLTSQDSSTAGSTFTPATYIESGHTVGKDANDTAFTTTLYAPANAPILSPLSGLVYLANSALIGTTTAAGTVVGDLNSSFLEGLEANATALAANLGLGDVDLLTADPIELIATNPTYALVNALLKTATAAQAGVLIALTAPTTATLQTTLQSLSDAGLTGLTDTLLTAVKNGSFTTDNIAAMSIDQSVAAGTIVNTANATLAGNFTVDDITLNAVSTEGLSEAGAKVLASTMSIVLDMSNVKTDTNISNTAFTVYLKLDGSKDSVADTDNNSSTAMVVAIPFDLNLTDGVLAATVAVGASVPFEVRASNGEESVYKGDFNATTMDVSGTTVISGATTNLTIDAGAIFTAINTELEQNLTDTSNFDFDMSEISSVQVLLSQPTTLTRVTTDGLNALSFATADLAGITGDISAVEAVKLFSLTTTDFRTHSANAATTQANSITNETLTINGAASGTGTTADPYIINDDSNLTLQLVNGTFDNAETNDTITITSSGTDLDLNTTTIITESKANVFSTVAAGSEFNTSSTTAGDINYTITTKSTDEFGESNTTVHYVTGNRAPSVITTAQSIADTNLTDGNITSVLFTDIDTSIITTNTTALISDLNTTSLTLSNSWQSFASGGIDKVKLSDDNTSLDINGTDSVSAQTLSINITAAELQDIHGSSATVGDFNITIQ